MLGGRLPYETGSLAELALRQQEGEPSPLRSLNPDVAPELSRAVSRSLAARPEHRYASAAEFSEAIREGARGHDSAVTVLLETAAHTDAETAATQVAARGATDAAPRNVLQPTPAPVTAPAPPRPSRRARRAARGQTEGTLRAAGTVLCHIQVVKEQAEAHCFREKIWYPTRDSNPEEPVSETGAYAVSASGAHKSKKPGDLAAHPGSEKLPTSESLEDLLLSRRARARLA